MNENLNNSDSWQSFVSTGSVFRYLEYRQSLNENKDDETNNTNSSSQ